MKKLVLFISFLFLVSLGFGDVTEDFDGWSDSSYGDISTYDHTGVGQWETYNTICGPLNARSGNCVRFNDDSGENEYLLFSGLDGNGKDGGVGTISFWYRHWDGDASNVQFQVQYKIGAGSWIDVGSTVTVPNNTTYYEYSENANVTDDNVFVQVISIDDAERLCIDDFSITDYSGGGSVSPVVTPTAQGNTTSTSVITINAEITDGDGDLTTTTGSAPSCWYRIDGGSWNRLEDTTPVGDTFSWDIPGQSAHTLIEYYIAAQDDEDSVTTSPSGGSGTTPPGSTAPASFHSYNILKSSPTIYDVQNYRDGSDNSYYSGETVSLTGIVTGIYGTSLYTIQNGSGAWNGIWISDDGSTLAEGHDVTVSGTVAESSSLTVLNTITATITNSTGNSLPAVSSITTADVNTEQYEGVYVFVNDATCTNASLGYGEWEITSSASTACRVDDLGYVFTPTLNNVYDVTGIGHYSFGNYKLQPRDSGDVVLVGDPTPPTIVSVSATSSTTVVVDFSEDVDQTTAQTTTNYSIDNGIGTPSSAVRNGVDNSIVTLSVSTLSSGITYTITINNVEDLSSNPIAANSQDTFTYELLPSIGDLVITEICGDGADGLNNDNGFMEIYNTTSNTLSLANVQARYFNSNPAGPSFTLDLSGTIAAGAYIVITQDETVFNTTYAPTTADFYHASFWFNGGDDGVDIYLTTTRAETLDEFNDNGVTGTPFTWNDDNVFERTSTGDGALSGSWTEITTGIGTPGADNDNPLPVTLSTFYAIYNDGTTTIYWATESEENNQGWNIYRGENADALINNETITINSTLIPGAGTTTQITNYQFEDEHPVDAGSTYWYWLEDVDYSGETEIHPATILTIPSGDPPPIPKFYGLHQNYPNPFNPSTIISFSLTTEDVENAEIIIYNTKGQIIKVFNNLEINSNEQGSITWDGKEVASGLYFYKLKTEKKDYSRKMLMIK